MPMCEKPVAVAHGVSICLTVALEVICTSVSDNSVSGNGGDPSWRKTKLTGGNV